SRRHRGDGTHGRRRDGSRDSSRVVFLGDFRDFRVLQHDVATSSSVLELDRVVAGSFDPGGVVRRCRPGLPYHVVAAAGATGKKQRARGRAHCRAENARSERHVRLLRVRYPICGQQSSVVLRAASVRLRTVAPTLTPDARVGSSVYERRASCERTQTTLLRRIPRRISLSLRRLLLVALLLVCASQAFAALRFAVRKAASTSGLRDATSAPVRIRLSKALRTQSNEARGDRGGNEADIHDGLLEGVSPPQQDTRRRFRLSSADTVRARQARRARRSRAPESS